MRANSNVTIREIAVLAEVSVSTVSLVLRNSPLVADKTREKVQACISSAGYVYNRSAASMRSQRSNVIAISVNDLANPYFAGLTSSIERALDTIDRTVLLSDVREDAQRQTRFIDKMLEHSVDGLLLCPAHTTDAEALVNQLGMAGLPCVLVSRNLPDSGLDYAGYDHCAGMRMAVQHLIELGHRRIALLGGSAPTWVSGQRRAGYREALAANGLPHDASLEIGEELTRSAGFAMAANMLALREPPTAAACANDIVAFGVMLGLRHHGIEPGRDFSVTGSDDVAEAALCTPALTTVAPDFDVIGETAAKLLLARIDDPSRPAQNVELPVHLKIRGSTAAPARLR